MFYCMVRHVCGGLLRYLCNTQLVSLLIYNLSSQNKACHKFCSVFPTPSFLLFLSGYLNACMCEDELYVIRMIVN